MKERIGIVVAEFNSDITEEMLKTAQKNVTLLHAAVHKVVRVPGVFEIPFAVNKLLKQKDIDAVVCLGTVITGGTSHDQIIARIAAQKIADLSIHYEKPVTLGISGPGMTRKEAIERIDDYAKRSVEAAIKMLRLYK